MAYLASIGVAGDTLSQPVQTPVAAMAGEYVKLARHPAHGLGWVWIVFLAIILALVACGSMVLGEEPPPSPLTRKVAENNPADRRVQDFEARLRGVDAPLSSLNERVNQNVNSLRSQLNAEATEVRELLLDELRTQAAQTSRRVILLTVLAGLLTALAIMERSRMRKRLDHVELSVLGGTAAFPQDNTGEGNWSNKMPKKYPSAPCDVVFKPVRSIAGPIPSMREQLDMMIEAAAKLKRFRVKLRHPEGAWTMGLATAKGNVRTENQDYGLCFQLDDDHDVLIVADGCGGVPYGQRAAYVATVTAAASVVQTYRKAPLLFTPHAQDAAAQAIKDAAHRLAVEGDKLNVTELRDGLRTTLIVLVGNKREVAYAYIGDGGGYVVRASGAIESFLLPQKASALAMNVLAASLGPTIEGEFVVGTIKRKPGDLVLVGTDGVFDRVGPEFPKDVLRGCIQFEGDLQATADHVIEELVTFKDGAGYVCDDNSTLGLLGDGTTPRLSNGFWFPEPPQETPAEFPPKAVGPVKETAE
jgi:serine/threonine protein phosphatase PrpC